MNNSFGPIRQNGCVVRDLRAALTHWTQVIGVGPFFHIDQQPLNDFRYRGEPSEATISVALAQSGGIQIELSQPLNDAPSAFRDFLRSGRKGCSTSPSGPTTSTRPCGRPAAAG